MCPLLDKAHTEACAGFLVRRAAACPWWVDLGLGPLVGRAVSRGMSRGGDGLKKSLGSLSAEGWDCVPS